MINNLRTIKNLKILGAYTLIIIISGMLLSSCSDKKNTVEGFWLDTSYGFILEFTENKIIVTPPRHSKKNTPIAYDYEKVDDTRYQLIGGNHGGSPIISVDWEAQKIVIPKALTYGHKTDGFYPAKKVSFEKMKGLWVLDYYDRTDEDIYIGAHLIDSSGMQVRNIAANNKTKKYYAEGADFFPLGERTIKSIMSAVNDDYVITYKDETIFSNGIAKRVGSIEDTLPKDCVKVETRAEVDKM